MHTKMQMFKARLTIRRAIWKKPQAALCEGDLSACLTEVVKK
jgi:hypothetical protein